MRTLVVVTGGSGFLDRGPVSGVRDAEVGSAPAVAR